MTNLLFFAVGPRDETDPTIRKNTNTTETCPGKKKEKKSETDFQFLCTWGSNTRLKFQIDTRKIERGIAVTPLVFVTFLLLV